MRQFDWNDLRYFLELVRAGNPATAGRRLKADHTTVRRRIATLEEALGTRLFISKEGNYQLTRQGDQLVKFAEAIEALTMRVEDQIADTDLALSGIVRVGAPDGFASHFMAPRLGALLERHPALTVELVVGTRMPNLSRREVDVAVVTARPVQGRQIIRKLTDFTAGMYASEGYLQRRPPIASVADLADHSLVAYVGDLLQEPEVDLLAADHYGMRSTLESTSVSARVQATLAGIGLCMLPDFVAVQHPALVHVLPHEICVEREYWLVIHTETINLARVRTVVDVLIELVQSERQLFIRPGEGP